MRHDLLYNLVAAENVPVPTRRARAPPPAGTRPRRHAPRPPPTTRTASPSRSSGSSWAAVEGAAETPDSSVVIARAQAAPSDKPLRGSLGLDVHSIDRLCSRQACIFHVG